MPSRRATLQTLGVALSGVVAGCLGDEQGTPTDRGTEPPTTSTDGTPSATQTADETPTVETPADARWAVNLGAQVGELRSHDGTLYAGTDAGVLVALDPTDGSVRWRFDAPNPVRSLGGGTGILAERGTVYAVSGTFDGIHAQKNRVHAVDAATGEELWTYAPGLAYKTFDLAGTADGALFVGTNDDALSDQGDPTVALETATGAERWRVGTGDVSGIAPGAETTVVGAQSLFRGLATADGSERWSVSVDELGLLPPRVAGETAYVGASGGSLRAVAVDSGTEQWTLDAPVNSVLVGGMDDTDGVFVGGRQVRHAGPDGDLRWTTDESLLLAVATDERLLGFGESAVTALSPDDGAVQWRAGPDAEYPRPHAVSRGVVVAADGRSPRLFGVDAESGTIRWTFDPGLPEVTDPVVADGAVVLAESGQIGEGRSGRVVARNLTD